MPAAAETVRRAVDAALEALGPIGRPDVPIGPMTTYRVGGIARVFAEVTEQDHLALVAAAARASGLPILVIGRGSNLLVADRGFDGIAVSIADVADAVEFRGTRVIAGSAVLLPVLARKTAAAALTGFEWAVGVPGSVGGAVRMNAGGHGSDMAAALVSITVADLASLHDDDLIVTRTVDQLGLRFRGSALAPTDIVLDATVQLAAGDRETSEREIAEIVQWRRANQPGGQNAGSVFVNPVPGEVTCGALIDAAGLRGFRHGSAEVSGKHANFIQADDGGSADDVRHLMRLVRDQVAAHSGYVLRSEIRLVGFGDEF